MRAVFLRKSGVMDEALVKLSSELFPVLPWEEGHSHTPAPFYRVLWEPGLPDISSPQFKRAGAC